MIFEYDTLVEWFGRNVFVIYFTEFINKRFIGWIGIWFSLKIKFDCWSKSVLQSYPKCFCCLVQVFYHGFNKKTVEPGQKLLGFVLLIWLSLYFVAGRTIFRCLISACLHCLWQKNKLTLGQHNLLSLGTKGNYKGGKEIFLAIDLVCKLSFS